MTTPATVEPTDEQLKAAWRLVIDTVASDRFVRYMDDLECGCAADLLAPVVARALAAAVAAEREKYLRVADELKEHADNAYRERKLYPPESAGRARYEYRGLALALAARRIREVSR